MTEPEVMPNADGAAEPSSAAAEDRAAAPTCDAPAGPAECAQAAQQFQDATEVGDYFVSNYPPFSIWQSEQAPAFEESLKQTPLGGPLRPVSLYLHLPFCRQRCYYCYFRVHPNVRPATVDEYINAVLIEAALYREHPVLQGRPLKNVYFGGGTPTYLSIAQLERLIVGLRTIWTWDGVEEFTVEGDPGTITLEKMLVLRALGVNRVSLGFQTLTPGLGFRIGRLAGRNDCVQAYWNTRSAGIETINIDMLAGLQGEILQSWLWSVGQVADLEPQSITMCQMQLTHNSKYFAQQRKGRALPLPSWNDKREWVGAAFEKLERRGWRVVDGYTAARSGSDRTAAYTADTLWRGADLLALGESAFGSLNGWNYQNSDTLETYLAALRNNQLPIRRAHRLSPDEQLRRELLLTLKSGKLDADDYMDRYGVNIRTEFAAVWQPLIQDKLLEATARGFQLTRAGLLQVDALLPRLYRPEHQDLRYT